MRFLTRILTLTLSVAAAPAARAQDNANLTNAQEGLNAATPTDGVDEVSVGGGEGEFDLDGAMNGEEGGDEFFDNKPVDLGNGAVNAPASAFSGNVPQNAAALPADASNNAPSNIPLNAPANALSSGAASNVPMNIPANIPADVPANTPADISAEVPANAPVNIPAVAEANMPLTSEPEIDASPLPQANDFAGAPPVPGTMRLMAEGEAPEEYLVERGDTLFDICDQLLDEAGYWPRLWALNPDIKNPHFIFPNMRLRFYPGDDETPPYLQVIAEEDVIPIDKDDLQEAELVAEKVIFSEEEALFEDVGSVEVIGPEGVDALQDELMLGGALYTGSELIAQVPGFIFREEKDALAFVVGGREGEGQVGSGGRVLLEASSGITAGTMYTVLRPGGSLEDPVAGEDIGRHYEFIAHLKVEKRLNDDLYIGRVQSESRSGVRPDDIVVNYLSTARTIPNDAAVASLASASAAIVGFQEGAQEIGGQGDYAFLDKGKNSGVSQGMSLPIYQSPRTLMGPEGSDELPDDYEKIGTMRVIDVTDTGAVGYIVRNWREVRIGDRTDGKG